MGVCTSISLACPARGPGAVLALGRRLLGSSPMSAVVIIEDDPWIAKLLEGVLRDAGLKPVVAAEARAGWHAIVAQEPACILSDIELGSDEDGLWLTREVRSHATRLAATPIVLMSSRDDTETRRQGFIAGADVFLAKPFRVDEVVSQIRALIDSSSRLRESRESLRSARASDAAALSGDVRQLSIGTVMTLLGLEKRTGTLGVVRGSASVTLTIAAGCVEEASLDGSAREPLAVMQSIIAWRTGRFSFHAAPHRDAKSPQNTIEHLLLESARLHDEASVDDPALNGEDRPSVEIPISVDLARGSKG